MRKKFAKRKIAWCLLAAVAISVVLSLYLWQPPEKVPPLTEHEVKHEVLASTVREISDASKTRSWSPQVSSISRLIDKHQFTGTNPTNEAPLPPGGYSFVEFEGEMPKGRLPSSPKQESDDLPPNLGWLKNPHNVDGLIAAAAHAQRDWSFGWIYLSVDARLDDLNLAFHGADVEILGRAGRLVRAKLPGAKDKLLTLYELPEILGLGVTPVESKLGLFTDEDSESVVNKLIPAFVTLMSDDPTGEWGQALEGLGAEIGFFDPTVRVYAINANQKVINRIAEADFVAFIEPISVVQATHDTAVPAMGADALRTYQGSSGLFSGIGGAPVPIAVMDTGLNLNHSDISSNRKSICGANFVYFDPLVDDEDLWRDADGHGTHVTGTIAGNGAVNPKYAGMAPLVHHIRFAKVLNHFGFGNEISILRGMDFLSRDIGCPESGWSTDFVSPLIVNMSLSRTSRVFEGRTLAERKLDSIVWGPKQLYVVAQSNSHINGFSNYASAKNSLAVGAALDDGTLAGFSSHGPTRDGRLAPQIVGTGVDLCSALGDGSRDEYRCISGTSMSSPAVAGVATLLMNAVPQNRGQPALVRARLMASAIKPEPWIEDVDSFPNDNTNGPGKFQVQYGLGKVSARTSVLNKNERIGWQSSSAIVELDDGEYAYQDIQVPPDTARLDLVLTWDEPPTDTFASAVLNDLDLWLDRGADCTSEPCGEYSSRSQIDNVEWIIVRNPTPGNYRAKIAAHRVYTDAPRAALAWTMIRGNSTPNLQIEVDQDELHVEGSKIEPEIAIKLTADEYVAAGTRLFIDCRVINGASCNRSRIHVRVEREDGIVHELDPLIASSIEIGELAAGETQSVKVRLRDLLAVSTYRLYFKASAWNANPASTSTLVNIDETRDTDLEEVLVIEPKNVLYQYAKVIAGDDGNEELDLMSSHVEPGEPRIRGGEARPAGSVWFQWTSPATSMISFSVTPEVPQGATFEPTSDNVARDPVRVTIFKGSTITNLETVAAADWGAQFFARKGQKYRIRVSHDQRAPALMLSWSSLQRPPNDHFVNAIAIESEVEGSIQGSNEGATLEQGELFGEIAATVWYRWQSPHDGFWLFESSVPDLRVLVFAGRNLANLRLVSSFPDRVAVFATKRGEEYWIALGSSSAHGTGSRFELKWNQGYLEGNDLFSNAEEIPLENKSQQVLIDTNSTIEPEEPEASGVRTEWWSWTAPESANFTWHLDELTQPTQGPSNKLMVSVFEGESLSKLRLVATNGERMNTDFSFSAVANQRYWISAGFPIHDHGVFTFRSGFATLVWGLTPVNDLVNNATSISGLSGFVMGSNKFATGSINERRDLLGRSTLWWNYKATESGWIRFKVDGEGGPWVINVHVDSNDNGGGLHLIASHRWQRTENEVRFEAKAGTTYTISLGLRDGGRGGEFSLEWEEVDDPGWLRFGGHIASGMLNSEGERVDLRDLGDIVIPDQGSALYVASERGLHVFERDENSSELTHVDLLEINFAVDSTALLWDSHRGRLIAKDCDEWWEFELSQNYSVTSKPDELKVEGDPKDCHSRQLIIDRDGSNIYEVVSGHINQFSIQGDGTLRFIETERIPGILRAVLSNSGDYIYGVYSSGVRVIRRDRDSGQLALTDYNETTLDVFPALSVPLAITDDDDYLFAYEGSPERTSLFSLNDPENPEQIGVLPRFWDSRTYPTWCTFGSSRKGLVAVDVFCPAVVFSVNWDKESESLVGSDSITLETSDKHNSPAIPQFGGPIGFDESTDRNYLYLSTPRDGIVIFARNAPPQEEDEAPDLSISSLTVDNPSLLPLDSFTLSTTVQNRSTAESATSTLRFYRSRNELINRNDTQVGSNTVPTLPASVSSMHSADLTAPRDPGRYYYGACVDEVALESDISDNCSGSVIVTVNDPVDVESPDLVIESPTISDENPTPNSVLTLGVTVRNRGDGDAPASVLRFFRSTNDAITSNDVRVGVQSVASIAAHGFSDHTINVLAPASQGTVYFGACVADVSNESDVENNCSSGVMVNVEEVASAPDLALINSTVDNVRPQPEGIFTFSTTVVNFGEAKSETTLLRYYLSDDSTINDDDTQIGSDSVDSLDLDETSHESISITAPTQTGTYFYGACVDVVANETYTGNNCSRAIEVRVVDDFSQTNYCRDDDVVQPGTECEIYDTGGFNFVVDSTGRGCLRAGGFLSCHENRQAFRDVTINGIIITLVADRGDDDSWAIEDVEPEPN